MKFTFVATGCVPPEVEGRNVSHAHSLGLPFVQERPRPALAVVGGGPSIKEHIEVLRDWQGDVWASGSAFPWCRDHDIRATFLCVDPQANVAPLTQGAIHAILGSCSDPAVFEALKGQAVEIFDLHHKDERTNHGPTTVTCTPELAIRMGYRDVSYFGCESSYSPEQTHAYMHQNFAHTIRVVCGGSAFITNPAFLLQAEYLATMIRLAPHLLRERSGGLLSAMVREIDYDITHGTAGLHKYVKAA